MLMGILPAHTYVHCICAWWPEGRSLALPLLGLLLVPVSSSLHFWLHLVLLRHVEREKQPPRIMYACVCFLCLPLVEWSSVLHRECCNIFQWNNLSHSLQRKLVSKHSAIQKQRERKSSVWGWRDGSAFKSTCCSCKGPGFSFQQTCDSF